MQHRTVQQIEVRCNDENLLGREQMPKVAVPDQAEKDGQPGNEIERQQPGTYKQRAAYSPDLSPADLMHHAAEAGLPGIHLDHLDALDDFVHEAHPPVRAVGRLQPERGGFFADPSCEG